MKITKQKKSQTFHTTKKRQQQTKYELKLYYYKKKEKNEKIKLLGDSGEVKEKVTK